MDTLYRLSDPEKIEELADLVAASNWGRVGDRMNYVHTHNRVHRMTDGIACEQICKNEYGSVYGLNLYSFIPNIHLPNWLEFEESGPDWTDLPA